jgi:hypothetical protein
MFKGAREYGYSYIRLISSPLTNAAISMIAVLPGAALQISFSSTRT